MGVHAPHCPNPKLLMWSCEFAFLLERPHMLICFNYRLCDALDEEKKKTSAIFSRNNFAPPNSFNFGRKKICYFTCAKFVAINTSEFSYSETEKNIINVKRLRCLLELHNSTPMEYRLLHVLRFELRDADCWKMNVPWHCKHGWICCPKNPILERLGKISVVLDHATVSERTNCKAIKNKPHTVNSLDSIADLADSRSTQTQRTKINKILQLIPLQLLSHIFRNKVSLGVCDDQCTHVHAKLGISIELVVMLAQLTELQIFIQTRIMVQLVRNSKLSESWQFWSQSFQQ